MLGYAREEYVGHHIAEFHADAPVIEDTLERLTRGETLREHPARLRSKDGSIRHVLISSNVLWEEGKFVHTRCFTRDITERKRAEEALKDADRRKDEFLATLAHELRNPLAPIRNSLTILQLTGGLGPAAELAITLPPEPVTLDGDPNRLGSGGGPSPHHRGRIPAPSRETSGSRHIAGLAPVAGRARCGANQAAAVARVTIREISGHSP